MSNPRVERRLLGPFELWVVMLPLEAEEFCCRLGLRWRLAGKEIFILVVSEEGAALIVETWNRRQ